MEGDKQGGFSVFWADDGLDTGPILLQKSVDIDQNETVDTLYNRFLYPEGIKAMVCYIILLAWKKFIYDMVNFQSLFAKPSYDIDD